MNIIVSSCSDCPFCNKDSKNGRDRCNIDIDIKPSSAELPDETVEEDCPLLQWEIKIMINSRLKS